MTEPIYDEGYGQPPAPRSIGNTLPNRDEIADLKGTRQLRSLITVLVILLVTMLVGFLGMAYGSSIDLFS